MIHFYKHHVCRSPYPFEAATFYLSAEDALKSEMKGTFKMDIYVAVLDGEAVGASGNNEKDYRYKHSSVKIMFKLEGPPENNQVCNLEKNLFQ